MSLLEAIRKNKIPKVILRYIMMKFLDLSSIKNIIMTVSEMNVLDAYSKDILRKASKGFYYNCKKGHLIVAQWLYSTDNVDIHDNNECTFRWSCENGHLDVAQWLYSLGNINIHVFDKYKSVFRYLPKNILAWLQTPD